MLNENLIDRCIPIREQVARLLRKMIITGELSSGDKLNEHAISEQLNISTTPVKEALRILESEGLITTVARKGSFISNFSKEHIKQIIYARAALEGVASYFAVENMTDDVVCQLEKILQESYEIKEKQDIEGFNQNNTRFHQVLRANCHNEYINKMIEILRAMDRTTLSTNLYKDAEEFERSYQEHLRLLEAVRQRNSAKAEKCAVEHTRRVANQALEQI